MKLTKTLIACLLLGSVAAYAADGTSAVDGLNSCKNLRKQLKSREALSCFYKVYQKAPANSAERSEALVGMGWSFYRLDDFLKDEAIKPAYKACLGANPVPTGNAVASSIGMACVNQANNKNITPFWNSMRLVVEAFHQQNLGEKDEPILTLQKAINLDPKNEVAHYV